jgi:hypothetical protein
MVAAGQEVFIRQRRRTHQLRTGPVLRYLTHLNQVDTNLAGQTVEIRKGHCRQRRRRQDLECDNPYHLIRRLHCLLDADANLY